MSNATTWHRYQSCDRKQPFGAEHLARRAALVYSWTGADLTVYECRYCGYWHVAKRVEVAS